MFAMQSDDSDVVAVGTRLTTYITSQAYLQSPEGREMPRHDESTLQR